MEIPRKVSVRDTIRRKMIRREDNSRGLPRGNCSKTPRKIR